MSTLHAPLWAGSWSPAHQYLTVLDQLSSPPLDFIDLTHQQMNVTPKQIKAHPRIKKLSAGIQRVRNYQNSLKRSGSQAATTRSPPRAVDPSGGQLAGKGLSVSDRNPPARGGSAASRFIVSAGNHGFSHAATALATHMKSAYPRDGSSTSLAAYRNSATRLALVANLDEEREHQVPIMRTGIIEASLPHKPDRLVTTDEGFKIDATFYLTEVHLSSAAPAGSPIGWVALSPVLMPHSLLRRLANMFEQFRFDSIRIEYIPMCPSTTSATIAGAVTTDVYENPSYLNSGNNLIRAMVARPGFDIVQAFSKAVFELKYPQQQWYHTSALEEPALTIPGAFTLVSAGSGPGVWGDPPTPLGILIAHVGCSFRSMRLGTLTADPVVGTNAASPAVFHVSFLTGARGQWTAMAALPAAFTDLSSAMELESLIVVCHIVQTVDPTAVSVGTVTSWRTVTSIDGRVVTLADNIIFMRFFNGYFYFYANLGEAVTGASDPDALTYPEAWTSTAGTAVMSFNRAYVLDLATGN